MKSDTSERGLETIIVTALVDEAGYIQGDPQDYDREHAVDLAQLLAFLNATQPNAVEQLGLASDGPRRQQFLHRLQGEITRHGVIHVLRHGVKHGPASLDLFYGTPSPGNANAAVRFAANIFSVTRQLHYSKTEAQLALDLCIFINGLPVITFELKNRLTKQTIVIVLGIAPWLCLAPDHQAEIGVEPGIATFRDIGGYEEQPLWFNVQPGLLAHLATQTRLSILAEFAPTTRHDPELTPVGVVIDIDQQDVMVTYNTRRFQVSRLWQYPGTLLA
nr:type I restriction endonuclease [Candidatus Chloroploca sp. Khr17]